MKRTRIDQTGSREGQGMVEFALVFPFLLVIVLGIFEFGRLLYTYSAVVSAAREGARYGAAIQDIGGGIPQYKDCEGIRSAVKRIGGGVGIEDDNIQIQYSNDGGVFAPTCPPTQEVRLSNRIAVSVETTIEPMVPFLSLPSFPIRSTSNRTILEKITVGESGTGVGSISGAVTDVNFKTTSQTAEETKGTISVDLVLNQVASEDVTVPFSITGTSEEGSDFTITSSPVIIPAGSQTTTIYINLVNDGVEEGDETLYLGLGEPTNATKGPQNIHAITIVDPPQVYFSTSTQSLSEGSGNTTVTVELSKGSSQDVNVPYSTSGDAEWGTTKDYTSSPDPVVIPAGSLSREIMIDINDDELDEVDESAILTMDMPSNAILGSPSQHTLQIVDNDDPPEVSFHTSSISISEEVGTLTTAVYLSAASAKEVSLPYSLSGTTTEGDYTVQSPSPLTISPGNTRAEISFSIAEGDGHEEDETLVIALDSPSNAAIGAIDTQTVTITEDTPTPVISFETSASSEGEDGGDHGVGVRLSNGWKQEISVNYSISGTADEGSEGDVTIASSPLVIPVGQVRGEIALTMVDDNVDEDDETVIITIDSVDQGTLGTPESHTLTILDDDSSPEVTFTQAGQITLETEGSVSIGVELSSPSSKTISIPLSYAGSATEGEDYSASTTTLNISPGMTSATFSVDVMDDAVYDPQESIVITMESPTNATLGNKHEHTIEIEDDEIPPCQVKTHLLTVGTTSITWTLQNVGEDVTFIAGSVSWPESSNNKPRLTTIYFDGSTVFSGNEKPGTLTFSANELFASGSNADLSTMFDSELGTGEHTIVTDFQNPDTGDTCSQTITYNKP